ARAFASRVTAEPIPLAASEMANSRPENGSNWFFQVSADRSLAFRQKTAVMLAGSIPTKVGRPQKRSRQSRGFQPATHTPGRGRRASGRLAGPRLGPNAPG